MIRYSIVQAVRTPSQIEFRAHLSDHESEGADDRADLLIDEKRVQRAQTQQDAVEREEIARGGVEGPASGE